MIAALFVAKDGPYFGLPNIDPWDIERDARNYCGPYPVVAHPPCERWGRYWSGGPSAKVRRKKGDDGDCFFHAFESVSICGGVLEHPEASHAWKAFGINRPPRAGGWVMGHDEIPGSWTCCVEQGHYGHPARKATWLYAVTVRKPPELIWGPATGKIRLDQGFHSAEERRCSEVKNAHKRLTKRECIETPPAFRDVLISIARNSCG